MEEFVKYSFWPEVLRKMNKKQYKICTRWLRTVQRTMNKIDQQIREKGMMKYCFGATGTKKQRRRVATLNHDIVDYFHKS